MQCSRTWLLLAAFGCLCVAASARPFENLWIPSWWFPPPEPEPVPHEFTPLVVEELPAPVAPETVNWFSSINKEFHSAVLVAGSKDYRNYRHQADVCHAYRILRERGLLDENIITMVYDDIAYHPDNPYKGQIFNAPGGRDVYPGCAKDYTGRDVTKYNLVAVLKGDADAVKGVGSGRVLKKDPTQRVFMFYSDHGSVGSVGMPTGSAFTAHNLAEAFRYMLENDFFAELVFYLESCESGSMFQGFGYEKESKILAVSASDYHESSFATYCLSDGTSVSPNASYIGSCMGDLFSVSWMEFTDANDVAVAAIEEQLEYMAERTADRYTYRMGSHMKIYAPDNLEIRKEVVGNFLSYYDVPAGQTKYDAFASPPAQEKDQTAKKTPPVANAETTSMPQRDADLMFLVQRTMSNDIDVREAATRELQEELEKRQTADRAIRTIVEYLMDRGLVSAESYGVEDYVMTLLPRDRNLQVVDDWECFERSIGVWDEMCGRLNDYSSQYTRAFANLCNQGVETTDFAQAAASACATNRGIY